MVVRTIASAEAMEGAAMQSARAPKRIVVFKVRTPENVSALLPFNIPREILFRIMRTLTDCRDFGAAVLGALTDDGSATRTTARIFVCANIKVT